MLQRMTIQVTTDPELLLGVHELQAAAAQGRA